MEKKSQETGSMVTTLEGSGPMGQGEVVVDDNSPEASELSKRNRKQGLFCMLLPRADHL